MPAGNLFLFVLSSLVNENHQIKKSHCKRCFKLLKQYLAITDARRESVGILSTFLVSGVFKYSLSAEVERRKDAPFNN
jgi:hypothetical protein